MPRLPFAVGQSDAKSALAEPPYIKLRAGVFLESAIRICDHLAARLGRAPKAAAEHLEVGLRGEDAAFFYLRRMGYVVVARRWQSYRHPGDLDLIAWEDDTLCFIEVKTRSSHAVAEAESAVDRDKRRTLRRLAWHYLRYLPVESTAARFDVVTVYMGREGGNEPTEFHLFRGAFGWSDHRERNPLD